MCHPDAPQAEQSVSWLETTKEQRPTVAMRATTIE